MTKVFSQIFSPTILLYSFLIITQIIDGIYLPSRIRPLPAFTFLRALMFLWIIGWWLQRDSRKRNVKWILDMGMFLYIAWPIIMPYYLFKTRGIKGFLPVILFIGIYLGATLIGVMIYVTFTS